MLGALKSVRSMKTSWHYFYLTNLKVRLKSSRKKFKKLPLDNLRNCMYYQFIIVLILELTQIMKIELNQIKEKLVQHNIRPSFQRIKVMEFLYNHDNHPTVEDIYQSLAAEIPSLSKATVYNTLHALIEGGLARVISIDENEMRYEVMNKSHGHFKCEKCGCIFNFAVNLDQISVDDLDQFSINEKNIFFKGLCPQCNQK